MTEADDRTEQTPAAVITLPEELDAFSAPAAAGKLTAAISAVPPVIIADLSRTIFLDSGGARMLYQAHGAAAVRGSELRLVTSHPAVLRVLELMGYDRVLPIYPTMVQAITASAPAG
jgi:anti-sigma B factor antagonist